VAIVERKEIKKLIDIDFIVICCGGGGIPVVRKERKFSGVEAVIDKDLASSVLAREINADIFIVASDVKGAAVDWGKPEQTGESPSRGSYERSPCRKSRNMLEPVISLQDPWGPKLTRSSSSSKVLETGALSATWMIFKKQSKVLPGPKSVNKVS
jgi:hypothetical protein